MRSGSMTQAPDRVLIVAEGRRGHGTGHIRRSIDIARRIGTPCDVVRPEEGFSQPVEAILTRHAGGVRAVTEEEARHSSYRAVLFDGRRVTSRDVRRYGGSALTVVVDAAGTGRRVAAAVFDPTLRRTSGANVSGLGLVSVENVRSEWPDAPRRILLVPGATADWTLWEEVSTLLRTRGCSVDIADGPTATLHEPDRLRAIIARYDCVITYYGRTAFEALRARVAVVLVAPTPYHRRLARRAGLPCSNRSARCASMIDDWRHTVAASRRAAEGATGSAVNTESQAEGDLAERVVAALDESNVMPRDDARAVVRFPDRSYFRRRDGLITMVRLLPSGIAYDDAYFGEEYRAQYGRTYVEDFDHIRAVGEARLAAARRAGAPRPSKDASPFLVDIGCAYGPFLSAAAAAGYRVRGYDVSATAVTYVRDVLGLAADSVPLEELSPDRLGGPADLVTMWYVIEHMRDADNTLETVRALVRVGGWFAFSTPNYRGVSGVRSLRRFLERSPADHYSVWSPTSARRVLAAHGFRVRAIRVTGHHPERFGVRVRPGSLAFRVILLISRILRLGDTFEVYAERIT